jgi:hypothetical protein
MNGVKSLPPVAGLVVQDWSHGSAAANTNTAAPRRNRRQFIIPSLRNFIAFL